MNKFVIFLVLLLYISDLLSQPILEFEGGNKKDWGIVKPEDSPLKADIKIWNKGNDTLKILNVKPTCGCTIAPIDKNIILPNEFATLSIKFEVSNSNGVNNKMIYIHTNIPDKPEMMFFLNANVKRDVTFEGVNYFNFGTLKIEDISEKAVKIKNNTVHDIKIIKISDLPNYCKINIYEGVVIPANGYVELKLTLQNSTPGTFSFFVKIKTELPKENDLIINAWGNVANPKDQ